MHTKSFESRHTETPDTKDITDTRKLNHVTYTKHVYFIIQLHKKQQIFSMHVGSVLKVCTLGIFTMILYIYFYFQNLVNFSGESMANAV